MSKTAFGKFAFAAALLALPAKAQTMQGFENGGMLPFGADNFFGPSGYPVSTRQSLHQEVLAANTEVSLSLAAMHSQYHENLSPGDDENGFTAGLGAGLSALVPDRLLGPNRDIYAALLYDFSAGNLTYGGHYLFTGQPVTATDRAVFNRLEARLGVGFALDRGFEVTPFLAAGYQAWNRNVSNKGEIATDEFYHTGLFGGGLKLDLPLTSSLVASASGEVTALALGGIALDGEGINQSFGKSAEERLTIGLDEELRGRLHLLAAAYWQHHNYSGSKPKIYNLGGAYYEIYEPLSITTQFGFGLGLAYSF